MISSVIRCCLSASSTSTSHCMLTQRAVICLLRSKFAQPQPSLCQQGGDDLIMAARTSAGWHTVPDTLAFDAVGDASRALLWSYQDALHREQHGLPRRLPPRQSETACHGAAIERRPSPWPRGLLSWLSSQQASLGQMSLEFCRAQLLENGSCCLDQIGDRSVLQRSISRPGTSWECIADNGCVSEPHGLRGDDLLSIPAAATCESCRILFLHGGSWYFGSPTSTGYHVLASKLAARTGCIVMMPDFPLLPVGDFDSMLQASIEAIAWLGSPAVLENCQADDPAKLFVGGDSSGATTAISLILHLQSPGASTMPTPKLNDVSIAIPDASLMTSTVQALSSMQMCDTPEYFTNAYSRIFNSSWGKASGHQGDILFRSPPARNMEEFREVALQYVGGHKQMLLDPVASPIYASAEMLAAVPPLHFLVGSEETLLGDSVILAQKAAASGATIVVDIYHGMWHDFPMYSEGCGSGTELVLGMKGWDHTAEFIQSATEMCRSNGWPIIRYVYDESLEGKTSWFMPARPLRLHGGAPQPSRFGAWPFFAGLAIGVLLSSAVSIGVILSLTRRRNLRENGQRAAPPQRGSMLARCSPESQPDLREEACASLPRPRGSIAAQALACQARCEAPPHTWKLEHALPHGDLKSFLHKQDQLLDELREMRSMLARRDVEFEAFREDVKHLLRSGGASPHWQTMDGRVLGGTGLCEPSWAYRSTVTADFRSPLDTPVARTRLGMSGSGRPTTISPVQEMPSKSGSVDRSGSLGSQNNVTVSPEDPARRGSRDLSGDLHRAMSPQGQQDASFLWMESCGDYAFQATRRKAKASPSAKPWYCC
eukprot:s2052_g6.t5